MRYGRTSSRTFSTLSAVSSSFSEIELSPAALAVTVRVRRTPWVDARGGGTLAVVIAIDALTQREAAMMVFGARDSRGERANSRASSTRKAR
jgi:hypothetical protein